MTNPEPAAPSRRIAALRLSRLKIGTRLNAGFGLVLLLLAFVGAVGFNGLTTSGNALGEYDRLTGNTLRVLSIERNVVALGREVIEYANTGSEAVLRRARALSAQIRADLQEAEATTQIEEQRPLIQRLVELEAAYATGLEKVAGLRSTRDSILEDELNPAAPVIQQRLSQGAQSAMSESDFEGAAITSSALEQFLLARANVMQFVAAPDPQIAATIKDQFATFSNNAVLAGESIRSIDNKKMISQVAGQVRKFAEGFTRASTATMEMAQLMNGPMAEAARAFAATAAQVKESQLRVVGELQASSRAAIAATQVVSFSLISAASSSAACWPG
jgi:methyl-accepting chemotaxis protein